LLSEILLSTRPLSVASTPLAMAVLWLAGKAAPPEKRGGGHTNMRVCPVAFRSMMATSSGLTWSFAAMASASAFAPSFRPSLPGPFAFTMA
jgi:hypothetical protein